MKKLFLYALLCTLSGSIISVLNSTHPTGNGDEHTIVRAQICSININDLAAPIIEKIVWFAGTRDTYGICRLWNSINLGKNGFKGTGSFNICSTDINDEYLRKFRGAYSLRLFNLPKITDVSYFRGVYSLTLIAPLGVTDVSSLSDVNRLTLVGLKVDQSALQNLKKPSKRDLEEYARYLYDSIQPFISQSVTTFLDNLMGTNTEQNVLVGGTVQPAPITRQELTAAINSAIDSFSF